LALSEEATARDEMEEVVALIEYDPVMSELETTVEEDGAILLEHLNAVKTKIAVVEFQIQQLPDTSPIIGVLEKKRASLLEEEMQIETVLTNEEQFHISQSALKKDEFYESVAPNFVESPPLQYILRSRQENNNLVVEANWDLEDEVSGSKEEWFRRFGDNLVADVPRRLMLVYNTSQMEAVSQKTQSSLLLLSSQSLRLFGRSSTLPSALVKVSGDWPIEPL